MTKAKIELPLFLTSVPAGFPSPAEDSVDEMLDLNGYLIAHPAATFFIRVSGSSMEGANIFSGDILIVDRSIEPSHAKIVVAIVDGEFTVKRFQKRKGKIWLAPENPKHKPIEGEFEVWGVVTYIIHAAR